MILGLSEIRARAIQFARDWEDARYEKGETHSFYNAFFEVFGRRRRDVALYEEKVKKLNTTTGFIDLFWPGMLLVEQKSLGRDLAAARAQATDYCLTLKENEKPRYILLSDFQNFELLDLEAGEEWHFPLRDLHNNIAHLGFIAGYQKETYKDQPEVNVEAANLMANLHEKLAASGYLGDDLEKLLVRLMFCLFADDTAIFAPDSFHNYVENRTGENGRGLGSALIHIFEVLDTPPDKRSKLLDEDLAGFPYVNGRLFAGLIRTPSFDAPLREALLQCCRFKWDKVSPALFGSLFQNVMLPDAQRKGGAHYTSEQNILKAIHPLFLDALYEEFEKIRDSKSTQRKSQLERFQEKLGTLRFLDPACGCGNFLILAYRELRLLEIKVLEELYPEERQNRQLVLDVAGLSKIDVDQFFGIEIEEFPAHIAEAALWLVDHQMNMALSGSFGRVYERLPLKKSATIYHGNALEVDWQSIVKPKEIGFILGNPPFVGKHLMSAKQDAEINEIFKGINGAGVLDYVCAWYLKAADYILGTHIKVAFVSTNSITQGEQVAVLWQALTERYKIHIHFAHQTFKWTIDEKRIGNMYIAAVHCVIIGFGGETAQAPILFDYENPTAKPKPIPAANINPYLVDAPDVVVTKRLKPLCDVPEMNKGSQPTDDGNFLFTDSEKKEFLFKEPQAEVFFRPMISAKEFINGENRWCLWLKDADPNILRHCPLVMERVERVKAFRLASKKAPTREAADRSTLFTEIRQPESDYLFIPRVSSENRVYVPFGFFTSNNIVSDTAICLPNATLYHFGVLTSTMHMTWMRQVCGRLESRYRYSNTLVYNNFPWPQAPKPAHIARIEACAQAVLDARTQFPNSTLADLYDPLVMPLVLVKAHRALDRAVDRAYGRAKFETERERLAFLFTLYQQLTAPLLPQEKPAKAPRRKRIP